MSPSEFSERPLVAGSLIGVRAYRVRADGALYGINFPQVVRPGVNHASCLSVGPATAARLRAQARKIKGLPPVEEPPHELVTLGCTCGFYAFFDGSNDYMRTFASGSGPRVEAIVESYGKVVVGSRGFRAEKLCLVALIRSDAPGQPTESRRDLIGRHLARKPRLAIALVGASGLGAVAFAVAAFTLGPWWSVGWPLAAGLGIGTGRLYRRGWRLLMEEHLRRLFGTAPGPTAADWTMIRAQYPGIPVYTSREAALFAHPLTVPEDVS